MFSSKGAIAFKKKEREKFNYRTATAVSILQGNIFLGKKKKRSLLKKKDKSINREIRGGLCVYFTHKLKHTSAMNPLENFAFNYISVNT